MHKYILFKLYIVYEQIAHHTYQLPTAGHVKYLSKFIQIRISNRLDKKRVPTMAKYFKAKVKFKK